MSRWTVERCGECDPCEEWIHAGAELAPAGAAPPCPSLLIYSHDTGHPDGAPNRDAAIERIRELDPDAQIEWLDGTDGGATAIGWPPGVLLGGAS